MNRPWWIAVALLSVAGCGGPKAAEPQAVAAPKEDPKPIVVLSTTATEPVKGDADDPAIWVHPTDPGQSLIFGTDKEGNGLYVFMMDGTLDRVLEGVERPNNVDIEKGFELGGATVDLAVATERLKTRLRIFAIDAQTGATRDVTGKTDVFAGEVGEAKAPMGIGLFKRADGQIFAIVGRKEGPKSGYLATYRLEARDGLVDAVEVKRFGTFSGVGEIEAIAVDDELGFVYCADEAFGIRKYHADPDASDEELATLATYTFEGDREGLAVYSLPGGEGYLVATEQLEGDSRYHVFERGGEHRLLKIIQGGADSTDGIEVLSANLGPQFPAGALIAMNSARKNFLIFDWRNVAETGEPKLAAAK